jgi:uncharacterized protein (TIGR00369 family)
MPSDPDLLELVNAGSRWVPYNAALGLIAEEAAPEGCTVLLPYREDLIGNPETGVIHGGAITALLDAACGLAVVLRQGNPSRVATLDLRIDYLKPATPPKGVRARAECYKLTRNVAFVRASAYHEDPKDPVASAAGAFMVFEDKQSALVQTLERP